jgi:hypothetical protein
VSRLRVNASSLLIALISGAVDYLLKRALFPEANAFSSVAMGLGCGAVILWLSQARAGREQDSGLSAESVLLVVLLLVGATALGFRFVAGYGASLVALGALSLLALAPLCERSMGRVVAQLMLSASAWFVLAPWWRWFAASADLARVDLDRAFVFLGLGLGVVTPLLLSAFCRSTASSGRPAGRAILIMVVAAAVPVLVAFFWLLDGLSGLLPGVVAAELVAVLLVALRGGRDVEWLCVGPIGGAVMLVGVRFGPGVRVLSAELGRTRKIEALAILVVIVVVVAAVSSLFGRGGSRRAGGS